MSQLLDSQPSLDPENWEEFRRESHRALDEMISYIATIRDAPVWKNAPPEILRQFREKLPRGSKELRHALDIFSAAIKPYATGNLHPLFMGWVHGAGTPVGMLAEMLAAGLNANCGGRNHIGLAVERQVVDWAAELFHFPPNSSGIFVTGTSAANLLALLVARTAVLGGDARHSGLRRCGPQLTAYASDQVHTCVTQACEVSGIGSRHLRCVPVDANGSIRIDALSQAVELDRRAGFRPFIVVATAGTVNTGAFDNLREVGRFCRAEKLWFHVDGAFGALCALSPKLAHLVSGIERADSVAFDFHKWAHVPYDAGFLLVRDSQMHRRTFSNRAAYLSRTAGGLASGELWPCDLGLDLSRGFRALKTWFAFQVFGADKIGACIEHTCYLAKYLEKAILTSPMFEVCAPVALNIVCFSLKISADGKENTQIVVDLQERGLAAPSTTVLGGKPVIRAAIVNHRTTAQDIDRFIQALHASALRVMHCQMSAGSIALLNEKAG